MGAINRVGFILALAPAACSFETRSDGFACESQADCDPGRTCIAGWCVTGASPDADPTAPDADPYAPDADPSATDAAPLPDADPDAPDAAPFCGDGTCDTGEEPVTCAADCATCEACAGGDCDQDCGPVDADCTMACTGPGCTCDFDCRRANNCEIDCTGDLDCDVDCFQANNCDKITCTGGARCAVDCTGANNCAYATCDGATSSCGGGVIVCNRGC